MKLLAYAKYAPMVVAVLSTLWALWERGEVQSEKTVRADDQAKIARALAEQEQQDRALSARLLEQQRDNLNRLHAQALVSLRKISDAPVSKDCGPVMRDASRSVRQLIAAGRKPPARP
jgi:hypothetical protein